MDRKDEKFITTRKSFGKYISVIYKNQNYYIGKYIEKYNLNRTEYKYLIQIYENEGICQDDIVNILKVDKYEVAKGVKSLIKKGYVYKEKDEIDKRKNRLYITELGNEIKSGVIEILKKTSEILTKGFKEEEKNLAFEFLLKMAENMGDEVSKIKGNK
ncbi:MarR family winged helix-turn-helix transcriptional regulator [Clostridium oceanicum]|uniref:MarR family transcriptional regulator n=1 Tax=Clostridium oceanicum TaxID=1543 RepID=A0ABN1JDC2_9CLOT